MSRGSHLRMRLSREIQNDTELSWRGMRIPGKYLHVWSHHRQAHDVTAPIVRVAAPGAFPFCCNQARDLGPRDVLLVTDIAPRALLPIFVQGKHDPKVQGSFI